jgi:hypothetical protein
MRANTAGSYSRPMMPVARHTSLGHKTGHSGFLPIGKSNAFAKHDRLIASIDTLKRPTRVQRLKDAAPWDLVVFDEAHHLTAFRSGNRSGRPRTLSWPRH